ncbi:methionine-R-sulfoxide reductase-like protein SelR [Tothia fuscella]|uniref:Peptide-methionine (R)-S-oxide reductase n=1 Tax=Tothia fuscella TaxID=1048955 RepID=A0A9P4NIZ4_9PEZI|nr:methionine-R-sulfoxide reductase-like protein SelR [Tothia fuscella]
MRFTSLPTFIRTLYAFSNTTRIFPGTSQRTLNSPLRDFLPKYYMPIPFFGSLFSSSSSRNMSYPLQKSDDEWQAVLSKEQFRVIREKGTEAPFTGKFDKHAPSTGVYTCAACEAPIYKATHKFKSGCGWPAFFDAIPGAVTRHTDRTLGMSRTEIVCSNCGGHLGHVFKGEGYATPTDERHCVNSVSLNFGPEKDSEGTAAGSAKV